MMTFLDIAKVPAINATVIATTTFVDSITDVLQIMLLGATLIWTLVKIAQALKDFHGED